MSDMRALLLTDVVDSTQLAEALGDSEAAALWKAHDRLARDLLPVWRGREIDKTDGMLLLFEAASDAAAYALAYHRALAQLKPPLKARAGLHFGPVILRENSKSDVALGAKPLEVEGTAKALTARVMSVANGRQTLLSADARMALGEIALRIESHGHWRMKGLPEPIELFEIGDADAPFEPPPDATKGYRVIRQGDLWLPARNIRHSLPAERDSFVGRREILVEISRRLDAGIRLVSVLGIGGSGKTRLVTRFGWNWLGDFPGGAWFCDLSQARSLDGILHAVAQGLDVPLGSEDPATQLGHAIAGRGPCLIILDNFEQVARHAEETLGRWLNRAKDARFLVTTREVLGLQGEEILALTPLQPSDAATMFLRRAEAASPEFKPDGVDPLLINRLVNLLDCLPLAIELAAARVRVMPPSTLLARMSERFKLLSSTGGRQDRQATLRTVLDWSWDLLSSPEKAALAQLSIFEGGFTLESVEAVLDLCACENPPSPMDALQSLVQKSLVRQVAEGRFDLLMSVKEYASEHLRTEGRFAESGPAALQAADVRHGAYFAGLDENLATLGRGAELDNFIVACRRAAARGDADISAHALERAWAGLRFRGPFRLGVELASIVRSTPGLGTGAIALVEWVAGRALADCGQDHEPYVHFEASLVSARAAGDRRNECRALLGLGALDSHASRMEAARTHFETALFTAREMEDRALLSDAHNGLGTMEVFVGRTPEAREHFEVALALAREAGDQDREARILGNLGILFVNAGRMGESRSYNEAALVAARQRGNRQLEGKILCNLGLLNQVQARLDEALGQLEAALMVARDLGDAHLESIVQCNLGMVYNSLARFDAARDQFEMALAVARESGYRRSEGQILGYLGLLHARQIRFNEAHDCLTAGEALLRALSDPLSLAILLCCRAETENLAGEPNAARAAIAEADSIAEALGGGADSELGLALARVRDLVGHADLDRDQIPFEI